MILINGKLNENLLVQDRGFMYGDGIFRTIHVLDGKPKFWNTQYKKLQSDCNAISINCPSSATLLDELKIASQGQHSCAIKIIVTRGEGSRGYKIDASTLPTHIIISNPMPTYPIEWYEFGAKIRICSLRLAWQEKLAGIKHLNRLECVLARMEWNDASILEGLLLDIDNNVVEGTMSNIFIVKNGTLSTPDLSRCGVAGVYRELILEIAKKKQINCNIRQISLADLLESDEVFLCNSLLGICPVKEMPDKTWTQMGYSKIFRQLLNEQAD